MACAVGSTVPIITVTGENRDASYTDGERTANFDLEADSYAVRWNTTKARPCSVALILYNAQSEKQHPVVFEVSPTSSSAGAFNLTLGPSGIDSKGNYYLTAQVDRDCGDGTWKVTLSPAGNGGSAINVSATPPSQSALASAYHRVVDPYIELIIADAQKPCTDSARACLISFFGALGQHSDNALNDMGEAVPHPGFVVPPHAHLDVPQCLEQANRELVAALDAFSESSYQVLADVSRNDPVAAQSDQKLFGEGTQHFQTARSLLAQASCE
jgi:hypothetical protein